MDTNLYWLWFSFASEKFRAKSRKLYKKAGNIEKIYAADVGQYVKWGVTDIRYIKKLSNKSLTAAEKELWYAENYNTEIVPCDSEKYPEKLKNIKDFPLMLYKRGSNVFEQKDVFVAIVGTRNATEEGKNLAYETAFKLAKKGAVIVSGMAAGIDTCAHVGALDADGKTISVFGCGVATAFPASNKGLMQRIVKDGCIYSEYGFEQTVYPSNFSDRNRIISAMADAVIVIEAGKSSGSLITARLADGQGKKLFVAKQALCGKDGENLFDDVKFDVMESADDVMRYFGIESDEKTPEKSGEQIENTVTSVTSPADVETMRRNRVIDILASGAADEVEIAAGTDENPVEIGVLLTLMEIEGLIIRRPDGKYIINN